MRIFCAPFSCFSINIMLVDKENKRIVACFTSPYILKQYYEVASTYINSYIDEISLRTFVKGVYGECEFEGRPSVDVML